MEFKKGDIVRKGNNNNRLYEVKFVTIDEVGNIEISIENISDIYDYCVCYPEQLEKLEIIS